MSFIKYLLISTSAFLVSCAELPDKGKDKGPSTVEVVKMTEPEFVFGFAGQSRYSYCPSPLLQEDGSTYIYFCGNPNNMVMVDNIYMIRTFQDAARTKEKSVLQPGRPGSWDDHHVCDPSVIEGCFKWGDEEFKYAMFFLSNSRNVYYNEIGVAFSNDLDADSWKKFPVQVVKKQWSGEGDQSLGGTMKSWGVGQPSAVSLDKKGKVLLTYTSGDVSGTRVVWRELDMSDVEHMKISEPVNMVDEGLKNLAEDGKDYTCNSEFAVNLDEDKIVMIRPVGPHSSTYPQHIENAVEIDWMNFSDFMNSRGEWKKIYRIGPEQTHFARNHNAALERNNFGHIKDWRNPTFYFTVSKGEPEAWPEGMHFAEWTYHIYKAKIFHKTINRI